MPPLPTKTQWDPALKGKGKILYSDSFRMKYNKADIAKKQFVCPRRDDIKYVVSVTFRDRPLHLELILTDTDSYRF